MSLPAHTMLSVRFLTKNSMTPTPPHPPYSSDLAPSNVFCFPMKKILKGKRFASVEEVKQKTAEALKSIKIDKFKNHFEQWEKHLDEYIA